MEILTHAGMCKLQLRCARLGACAHAMLLRSGWNAETGTSQPWQEPYESLLSAC